MNIKVIGRWFNLCDVFFDMVFKYLGNENVYNEFV